MSHGTVVAPQPEAVEAGAVVLQRGGNAVDAAVATALVQGVVDPQMCGIAGFGSMQLYLPSRGVHSFIDFHGRAPAATTETMWEPLLRGEARDGFGFVLDGQVNDVGYQSITVPGALRAYFEAQTEFGTFDWADVVAPAIEAAERGFVVRPGVEAFWTAPADMGRADTITRLGFSATGRSVYFNPDGSLRRLGQRVDNPDLARTLRRIAAEGPDIFYCGEIAEEMAADVQGNGGLLSLDDLRNYRTTRTDPLWGEYRGRRVATNNPPGGGVVLLEILHILEEFDLRAMGHNSADYVAVVAEAMKRGTIDKDAHVGDPQFVEVPIERLLSKSHARQLADSIRAGEVATVRRLGSKESENTTHVCVIDRDSNAVSMTHSLGMPSGVITTGLGFMYNGCMAVFDPRPGHAASLAPGKSRFSSMCPTIVFEGDRPSLVIGAPGGAHILIAVLQGILNVFDFEMTLLEAIVAPRFSATSDAIDVSNRIPRFVTNELEDRGYDIVRSPASYAFASLHALRVQDDGCVDGAADPGRDGMALSL